MTRPIIRRLALLVVGALALAACGSSDSNEELAAMLDTIEEAGASGALDDATEAQMECIVDAADDAGLTTAKIATADGQTTLTRIQYDCIPNLHELDSFLNAAANAFGFAAGQTPSKEEMRCYLDGIWDRSPDPIRTVAVADGPSDTALIIELLEGCLSEEYLHDLETAGPVAVGDDPLADALYDDCGDGDRMACELLFWTAAPDSALEDFAWDCGGGGQASGGDLCTAGLFYDPDGHLELSSPAIDDLVTECEAGDLVACDLLYAAAPFDSDIEHVGWTCGGRLSTGAVPSCRARLG